MQIRFQIKELLKAKKKKKNSVKRKYLIEDSGLKSEGERNGLGFCCREEAVWVIGPVWPTEKPTLNIKSAQAQFELKK